MRHRMLGNMFIAIVSLLSLNATPQSYPGKPVRMVNPSAPGGTIDTQARLFAAKLSELWGYQVLVENRAGSGGVLAADAVARAAPDGYTILFTSAQQAISAAYYAKLPFDPVRDFSPVTQLTSTSFVLVANMKVPAVNLMELMAMARSRPGTLNYGSSGLGSSLHLAAELFKNIANVDIVHIPYKSDALTIPALLGNEVQMAFLPTLSALNQMRSGKVRGMGVTSARRAMVEPALPTIVEAGLPGYELSGWIGVLMPGAAARDLVNVVRSGFVKVLGTPDVVERLVKAGNEVSGSTAEEFLAKYRADIAMYGRIIKDAKVPLAE
ncbi:MAG: tripartite tricarboxylate transporter substrate binding protein [Betaproteobacteria bacterium]|nr:tripartite tricarboxylate transporter substrate binding protein [Betaproteobacteria bacterium]